MCCLSVLATALTGLHRCHWAIITVTNQGLMVGLNGQLSEKQEGSYSFLHTSVIQGGWIIDDCECHDPIHSDLLDSVSHVSDCF